MSFRFEFVKPTRGLESTRFSDDNFEEGGDYEYFVMYACDLLGRSDCEFHIGGFGVDDWGFDVSYDMSSFMEELPALIEGVVERRDVEMCLYPQGVERVLYFSSRGSVISIRCELANGESLPNSVEEVSRSGFIAMLRKLAKDFSESLVVVAPRVAHEPPFEFWRNNVESAIPAS
ncbi:hypothetical protein ABZ864_48205 [Streptomyces sp. NPDC047082]|uniref:hypothetical protein n=1 Tax=Streptomyces sp. NPDC047082 TaxID=3155259 RepID=UPI0033F8973C